MAKSIYITSAEGHTGKSTVALGVLTALRDAHPRVGVFRPISRSVTGQDYVLEMLRTESTITQSYDESIGVSYDDVHADPDQALSSIMAAYKAIERRSDVVLVLGSDYTDVSSPAELGFNAKIAANLGAPVLLVLGGRGGDDAPDTNALQSGRPRGVEQMRQVAEVTRQELDAAHATLLGAVISRTDPNLLGPISVAVAGALDSSLTVPVWAIPEDPILVAPTVDSIIAAVDGEVVSGDPDLLGREAMGVVVAAMSVENVLLRLTEGAVVVVPGDRSEMLLAVVAAHASGTFPTLAGIILNGGFEPNPQIGLLLEGLGQNIPIARTKWGTYDTVLRIVGTRGKLAADNPSKFQRALSLFNSNVDSAALLGQLDRVHADVKTPLMFEYELLERARSQRKHIVLPEGEDDRILRAAALLLERDVVDLTILGEAEDVRGRAAELGINIDGARVVSPYDPVLREQFAVEYAKLREKKGVTVEQARDKVTDVSYFGTMMVHLGLADGMVSGASHTTAQTIRPSFEIVKTKPGVSVVSSVFLMCLQDRVLVYGDCAVNPTPTAEQLADIAVSSSQTAEQFGVDPRVAMLSYSTGSSGAGADVEKVREATEMVHERAPQLLVEGPIQYDAAADPSVAATKMPNSQVAGKATVFIFPDLNTGNNTYKAVQRSAGAVAIGPVLQGLNKPINDLSRGALIKDIVNTVAITAIQAQG